MLTSFKFYSFCFLLAQSVSAQKEECLEPAKARAEPIAAVVNRPAPDHPRHFQFLTDVPGNIVKLTSQPFKKESLKTMGFLGGATVLCLLADQPIIKGAGKLFKFLGVDQQEKFKPFLSIGNISVIQKPGNINSFFYQLGHPGPTLLLMGGFYLSGKLKKNTRANRTASELAESFLNSSFVVQSLKRVCGRQSPNKATRPGSRWQWFPSWKEYNSDMTNYFAYPSGHMATMMSAVTVISLNYPEKKWIRPLGYSLTVLTALSQLNNKTHWASDFLLGAAIGYGSAIISHAKRRK